MQPPPLQTTIEIAPGVRERALCFRAANCRLAANLVVPETTADVGVLFVHGFAGTRSGPHDLLTQLARELGRAGLASLRFDLRGRGESEGDGRRTDLAGMAADTVAAADVLRRELDTDRILPVGLCSGGNVAIGALPELGAVAGLVLLSVYPFSDGDTFGRDVNRTWRHLQTYATRACRSETWRRLMRGQIDLHSVVRVLCMPLCRSRRQARAGAKEPDATAAAATPPTRHLANLRPGIPTLMVYGTADPDMKAARRYYERYARERQLPVHFTEIAGANHNFSSAAWTAAVAELVTGFCTRCASPDERSAAATD